MITLAEENYLKAILSISLNEDGKVSTNAIAHEIGTSAASVSDMLKKLQDKKLIKYEKYKGVELSKSGKSKAINILRKHRLWETFLVNKLAFGWGEVHDVAEQLEHIKSVKLINSLDQFLNFPKYDPHGDPIPDKDGNITYLKSKIFLSESAIGTVVQVVSVNEDSLLLLKYLDEIGLGLGSKIKVLELYSFDESLKIELDGKQKINLSKKVSENIGVHFIEKL